ncbi:hypothetical protein V2W45_1249626, partial [Cenococcum geophilum]
IRLQWVPAYAIVVGDKVADELVEEVTKRTLPPILGLILISALKKVKPFLLKIKLEEPVHFNNALPSQYTKIIYDQNTYKKAIMLCQLRTGKCRLKSYLVKIGAIESDIYDYKRP